MIKINLGCGTKYLNGYVNCDLVKTVRAEKYFDLNKFPYPFKENFADEVFMDMVLEHLDKIPDVLYEIHRILKKNGILKIYVPYFKSEWAFEDPTHKHFFNERSMNYFLDDKEYNFYVDYRYELSKVHLYTSNKTFLNKLRNVIPLRNILKYFFFNMYDGIYFELKAIK